MQFQGDLKRTWITIDKAINKRANTTVVSSLTAESQTGNGNKTIA